MIANSTAGLTRGAVSTEPRTTTGFPDRLAGAVTKGLVVAPVGALPLIEAAYAWHRLRTPRTGLPHPSPDPASPGRRTRVPVVETHLQEVAVRLARLLSCLTWATIRRIEPPTGPAQPSLMCVDVPVVLYHRVNRGLTAAWRDAQRLWDRPTTSERDRHGAAVGLWRMAMLLGGIGSHRGIIHLRVGNRTEAGVLARAGECLGVLQTVDRVRGGFDVVVCNPGQVLRLLSQAGAGDAAWAWAKGSRTACVDRPNPDVPPPKMST
jgi:hypothetical protein